MHQVNRPFTISFFINYTIILLIFGGTAASGKTYGSLAELLLEEQAATSTNPTTSTITTTIWVPNKCNTVCLHFDDCLKILLHCLLITIFGIGCYYLIKFLKNMCKYKAAACSVDNVNQHNHP